MKHIISFLLVAAILFAAAPAVAQSDAIQRYFEKYMNDDRFDMVYISPKMFNMVSNIELQGDQVDPDIMDILKGLKGLRILSYEGAEAAGFYKEAREKININEYEELITARDGDEHVHIRVKESGNTVQELLLLVGGKSEFTLMSFTGNIDLKKVGKLGKTLNIQHIDQLEKINDKK